jgi:hypothetical protein
LIFGFSWLHGFLIKNHCLAQDWLNPKEKNWIALAVFSGKFMQNILSG